MKINWLLKICTISATILISACSNNSGHTHNPILHKALDATCTTSGNVAYYSCTCGKRFSDKACTKEITNYMIPALGHIVTHHNPIDSSCISHGTVEYYECNRCHHYFSDAECSEELTSIEAPLGEHNFNHVEAKEPTEEETGWIDHYKCRVCNKYFIKSNGEYVEKSWSEIELTEVTYHTVTFNYSGFGEVVVPNGSTVSEPKDTPAKSSTKEYSYAFEYWTLNNVEYDFSNAVLQDITLEAKFKPTPINYSITFKCEGKNDVVKYFDCETDPSTFEEPELEEKYGFTASWSSYSLELLEDQISNAIYTPKGNVLAIPSLQRSDGYTIKFHIVDNATSYEVYDDNDYREDPVTLYQSDADENGYLYYTPEVVGKHNIKVRPFADNYYSFESSPIQSVEIKEVFAYGLLYPVQFYDTRENPQASTYTLVMEDGSYKYVSQDEFNTNYTRDRNGIMDYTASDKIDEIMQTVKDLGYNIVDLANRFTNVEEQNYWWWGTSFETSCLKRAMDAAWRHGLKCYVADFNLMNCSNEADNTSIITRRLADKQFQKVFPHPAFYGIELKDEPRPGEEIVNMGNTIKTILSYWKQDSYLKTLPEPHFHTDLCSFNTNDTGEGAEQRLFPAPQDYEDYLESWITNTGLDYLYFDYYTYTTYIYGQENYWGTTYYYDSSKVIFDSINNLRTKYPNLIVHQTIDGSNYYNGRQALSYTNVFASTLLAVSQQMNGYSVFTFAQDSQTQRGNPVNLDGTRSTSFGWLSEANAQYRYLMGLLDGYSLNSNEMSKYAQQLEMFGDEVEGYGFKVRTSTSTFKNNNNEEYKMIVNYNTYKDNKPTSVKVNNGLTYYLFGYGKTMQPLTGTGASITLNNGEGILIKNY